MKVYEKPILEVVKLYIEENIASNTQMDNGTMVTVFDLFQTTSGI